MCGLFQFYPRPFCLRCAAGELEWRDASGNGRLHTFSVLERTPNPEFQGDLPYVLGIVELDEGVRVTADVVGIDHDQLRCEMPVAVTFVDGLPCFGPDDGAA